MLNPTLDVDPLFLIVGGILFFGVLLMLYVRSSRNSYEALMLIDIKARMRVVSRIYGDYLSQRKALEPGKEFYLIRRAHNMVVCRDYSTGDMFFMREFEYREALQEGRIKQFYE
jgi:hypothetical protein